MTRSEEIELENPPAGGAALPQVRSPFELPLMVYAQIMEDNTTRKQPYR